MLGRHRIIASFRGICESRRRLSATCIAGRVAQSLLVSNRLCLTKHERQNSIPYSVLVGRHVEIDEMVPASSIGAGVDVERLELSMVHDREPLSPGGAAPRFSETGDAHLEHVLTEPVATVSRPKQERKRRRGEEGRGGGVRVEAEDVAEMKKQKKENLRPNYFVSIPITNSKISEGVAEVQEAVLEQDPRLARAMVPIGSLHITLLVTHLANQTQVDLAALALASMEAGLEELLGGRGLVLPFCGLGTFRNQVVFVDLAPGGHTHTLELLAALTRKTFEERGLSPGDSRDFKPHLTFMKLSRAPRLRSQGVRRLDPALYSSFSQQSFGEERVQRMDLCSMVKKKTCDGYYHREGSVWLGVKKRAPPDDAELQRVSRKLVEEAVLSALQQYKEETHHQNGGGPPAAEDLNTSAVALTTTDPNSSK